MKSDLFKRCSIILLLVFAFFGFIYFNYFFQSDEMKEHELFEMYYFTGKVLDVNLSNKKIEVIQTGKKEPVFLFISDKTIIYDVYLENEEKVISKTKKEISTIDSIKKGSAVFIKSNSNIYNKKNINDISFIEVLF